MAARSVNSSEVSFECNARCRSPLTMPLAGTAGVRVMVKILARPSAAWRVALSEGDAVRRRRPRSGIARWCNPARGAAQPSQLDDRTRFLRQALMNCGESPVARNAWPESLMPACVPLKTPVLLSRCSTPSASPIAEMANEEKNECGREDSRSGRGLVHACTVP